MLPQLPKSKYIRTSSHGKTLYILGRGIKPVGVEVDEVGRRWYVFPRYADLAAKEFVITRASLDKLPAVVLADLELERGLAEAK